MTVTVNADVGEGIGLHAFGNDAELMKIIDVANVACGFHASDPNIMAQTVRLAAENNVAVGAHPGLPDLAGFGRRAMVLSPDEVENLVRYQVGALTAFLKAEGLPLNHIKPHGALFGMVSRDPELMQAVVNVALDYDVPVFGLPNSVHQDVAQKSGVDFVAEIYVDLNYDDAGGLIIERKPAPADPQKASERVLRALEEGVIAAVDGSTFNVDFQTVCVHSDPYNAPEVAAAVKAAISQHSNQHN